MLAHPPLWWLRAWPTETRLPAYCGEEGTRGGACPPPMRGALWCGVTRMGGGGLMPSEAAKDDTEAEAGSGGGGASASAASFDAGIVIVVGDDDTSTALAAKRGTERFMTGERPADAASVCHGTCAALDES